MDSIVKFLFASEFNTLNHFDKWLFLENYHYIVMQRDANDKPVRLISTSELSEALKVLQS